MFPWIQLSTQSRRFSLPLLLVLVLLVGAAEIEVGELVLGVEIGRTYSGLSDFSNNRCIALRISSSRSSHGLGFSFWYSEISMPLLARRTA
ncbi:hypothetical protein ASPSYDRAFT_380295 [Aspergillus sydowii CBS 593.65]|uniref:Secreted protein n=1 Tax=Aspergillus sydowii CBS 593.65 TaxID=1036612 RepID=A0A1L9U0Y0_9EURO|nr:uncharacterized protein ASPSYDRAFT_380295 [Aspergillus sydowii CBS 593.65]OJJ65311.1 hypothetical protein ASPSYDRAFT_380295 [Aspergillus sydowii CBS 593.65]